MPQNKKILVVDDMADNRELFLQYLEEDFAVVEATNGREAVQMAIEHIPDLILMDLSLPEMTGWEATQLILGLAVPPLLAIHLLGTKISALAFGTQPLYAYILLVLWVFSPWTGVQQAILVLVAWAHGAIGLHFWLRIRPWYPQARLLLFAGALLLPVLALLGFAEAGREVARLYRDPAWFEQAKAAIHFPEAAQVALGRGMRQREGVRTEGEGQQRGEPKRVRQCRHR